MKVIIKDWYIVTTIYKEEILMQNLWGIVVSDSTGRFNKSDYVSSSNIKVFNTEENIFVTKSGTHYHCLGDRQNVSVNIEQFMLLTKGYSPTDLLLDIEA